MENGNEKEWNKEIGNVLPPNFHYLVLQIDEILIDNKQKKVK
jgi:hypothetical protein